MDHLPQRTLTILGGKVLTTHQLITHRAQRQGLGRVLGGHPVEGGRFHLHRQHPHPPGRPVQLQHRLFRDRWVEEVRGQHVAHMGLHPSGPSGHQRPLQQRVIGDGGEIESIETLPVDVGIGASAQGDDHRAQTHLGLQGPTAAHPNEPLTTKVVDQLGGIDADGRHTHPGAHDRYGAPAVLASEAQHVTHRGHLPGIVQKGFGNPLGPQGVPG